MSNSMFTETIKTKQVPTTQVYFIFQFTKSPEMMGTLITILHIGH